MISLWDIDLQHEIHLDNSTGVVDRYHRIHPSVRRMYSAKIGGQSTTVAMYQGCSAEEEWRQELAKYTSIRHPNILQIRRAVSSGSIRATLFHDDLIPFKQYVNFYRHSHFHTVYIYNCCEVEFTIRKLVVVVQVLPFSHRTSATTSAPIFNRVWPHLSSHSGYVDRLAGYVQTSPSRLQPSS
ncbi:hypothetical protein B0H19DRAFT_709969 [Mycena capillaripes]|nr:hypothetical protein B0H19DRAFT_709969 [Mycena capillaripes]